MSELSLEEKATEAEHNTIILLLAQYKLSEAKQIVQSMMNSPINPEPLRNMLRSTSRSIISIQKKLSEVHICVQELEIELDRRVSDTTK